MFFARPVIAPRRTKSPIPNLAVQVLDARHTQSIDELLRANSALAIIYRGVLVYQASQVDMTSFTTHDVLFQARFAPELEVDAVPDLQWQTRQEERLSLRIDYDIVQVLAFASPSRTFFSQKFDRSLDTALWWR